MHYILLQTLLHYARQEATVDTQVLWLDLTAAKARYGRWIGGELPQFAEFARSTRARTARQKEAQQALQHAAAPQEADDEFLVRLRKLRSVTCWPLESFSRS